MTEGLRGRLKKTETCPCSSPGLGRFKWKPPPSPCHPAASPGAYAPITHKTVATVYAHDRRPARRWHRWPPLPRPPAPSPSQSLFSGLVGHTTRRICVRMVPRLLAGKASECLEVTHLGPPAKDRDRKEWAAGSQLEGSRPAAERAQSKFVLLR